jgi:hypothetical protein
VKNERLITIQQQKHSQTDEGTAKMEEMRTDPMRSAKAECKVVECKPRETETHLTMCEEKTMFELENVLVEYGDRTFRAEYEVERFLATLTEAQLAEAEVLVDDNSYVVFYPLLPKAEGERRSGYHFDLDSPRPIIVSADVPELVGVTADQSEECNFSSDYVKDRAAGLATLLASVRL